MLKKLHPVILVVLLTLALLAMAACVVNNPTGPQARGTPADDQAAGLLDLLATATATPSPTATTTPTPTSTPTPLPTPTPVAALSVGSVPAGQVLFSTQRAGEPGEQLWWMSPLDGLKELRSDLLPGGWHCLAGEQIGCAFVTRDLGLFARRPLTGTTILLDDLTPLRVTASMSITPTLNVSGTEILSPTLAITGVADLGATVPVTAAFATTVTAELAQGVTITATAGDALPVPVLAFSPSGQRLAVATQGHVAVYDLAEPALVATLQAGGPAELAWSPDGEQLALAYPASAGNAVALWSLADGRLRVLAQMEAAGRLAWAPDGSKLAFDARTSPETPSSQGGQPDVYILYLRSGEIANLTEVFLRNRGVDPSGQIGGWAPQWEPDSATVRYVRGVPGRIEEQNVVRHALRSRSPSVLWPAADAGTLGVVAEPAGEREARVIVRDGRDVLQVRQPGDDWQDATPGAFADVASLAWGPEGTGGAPGLVLLADRQMLWIVDPASGRLSGLSVACPDCAVTQALWLP